MRLVEVRELADAGERVLAAGDVASSALADLGDARGLAAVEQHRRHAAGGLDLLEPGPGPIAELIGEALDEVGAAGRIGRRRPRFDSSCSTSWVLRAMRRARPSDGPIAASNGCTVTAVGATATPAAKQAAVVRSMFTHGSRRVIIRVAVRTPNGASPPRQRLPP